MYNVSIVAYLLLVGFPIGDQHSSNTYGHFPENIYWKYWIFPGVGPKTNKIVYITAKVNKLINSHFIQGESATKSGQNKKFVPTS